MSFFFQILGNSTLCISEEECPVITQFVKKNPKITSVADVSQNKNFKLMQNPCSLIHTEEKTAVHIRTLLGRRVKLLGYELENS